MENSKYKLPFLQKYKEVAENISFSHFQDYEKMESNQHVIEMFQSGLLNNILSYFNAIWNDTNTDENLQILEVMRKDSIKAGKWRPTGKRIEEFVRPLEVNKLKWQTKFYEKQLLFQAQQIKEAEQRLQQSRMNWSSAQKRRDSLAVQIEGELQNLDRINVQLSDISDKTIQKFY